MKKESYRLPGVRTIQETMILSIAQTGEPGGEEPISELTALGACSESNDCQGPSGYATGYAHVCAEGILDPEDLNGASFVALYSDCDEWVKDTLVNCRLATEGEITCSSEEMAVTCEYEEDIYCGPTTSPCEHIGDGVRYEGELIECSEAV